MMSSAQPSDAMLAAFKRAGAVLRDAGIPFAVAGGFALWARGGSASEHDVDFFIREADADRALAALEAAGMRTDRPPEGWLVKAWEGDVLVDLIFAPSGTHTTEHMIERAEEMNVHSMRLLVATATDVMVTKLAALTEHHLDYRGVLETARALREQISWAEVAERVADSPFARAFLFLIRELGITSDHEWADTAGIVKERRLASGM
jgi:hypothetical protein